MSYYTVCKAVTSVAEITKQHDLLEIIPAMCNPDHAACWGESVCENGVSECKEASERMQIARVDIDRRITATIESWKKAAI